MVIPRVWKIKFMVLTLSTILSFLVAEVFLRFFYPTPYYGYELIRPEQQLIQYDPVLGWKGRSNAIGVFASSDFDVSVSHDAYGYRNCAPAFVDNKENIIVLGDSYGWGWGVADEEVFSSYITNKNRQINIYNLSIPGYGTDQEYLTLRLFLKDNAHPRYRGVVLLFYSNDFEDVLDAVRYSHPKPRFVIHEKKLELENVPVPELKNEEYNTASRGHIQRRKWILRQFHVCNLIARSATLMVQAIRQSWQYGLHPSVPISDIPKTNQALTLRLLKEIDALCKKDHMFFHVVLLVTSNTSKPLRSEIDRLAAALASESIEHSRFSSHVFPSTDLWIDRHFSKYGQSLLALHILGILQGKEALPHSSARLDQTHP